MKADVVYFLRQFRLEVSDIETRKKRWTCSIRVTVRLDSCRNETLKEHYTSLGAVDGNEPPTCSCPPPVIIFLFFYGSA